MSRDRHFRPGDNYVIDDITGAKIRASEAQFQWDGTLTHQKNHAPRHPQDFVRGRADKQAADLIRSEPVEEFIGPLNTETTAAASAGDILLRVTFNTSMRIGDSIVVMLDDGTPFRTTISSLSAIGYLMTEDGDPLITEDGDRLLWEDETDATGVLGLAAPLPRDVTSGAWVINNSAMAEATLP